MWTIVLLVFSNVFMTVAWYGHLRSLKSAPLWIAILASWGIALLEYCFQVPANRLGYSGGTGAFSLVQLKTIQEAITLIVFMGYCLVVVKESIRWNHLAGFALIVMAAFLIFKDVK